VDGQAAVVEGNGDAITPEWVIQAPPGDRIKVKIRSERAGNVAREIFLK
jgi:hypothetical protein